MFYVYGEEGRGEKGVVLYMDRLFFFKKKRVGEIAWGKITNSRTTFFWVCRFLFFLGGREEGAGGGTVV